MDGENFRLVSGLAKLSRKVENTANKHAANCSNQVTSVADSQTKHCGFYAWFHASNEFDVLVDVIFSKQKKQSNILIFFSADFRRTKFRSEFDYSYGLGSDPSKTAKT